MLDVRGLSRHLSGDVKQTADTTIPRLGKRSFCPGDKNSETASIFKVMTLNEMAQGKYKALGWRALPTPAGQKGERAGPGRWERRTLGATCKKCLQERGTSGRGVQENQAEESCEWTSGITADLSKNGLGKLFKRTAKTN